MTRLKAMFLRAPEGSSKLMARLGREMLSGKSLDANFARPLTGTVLTAPFLGDLVPRVALQALRGVLARDWLVAVEDFIAWAGLARDSSYRLIARAR
jgi:hypothetical protein